MPNTTCDILERALWPHTAIELLMSVVQKIFDLLTRVVVKIFVDTLEVLLILRDGLANFLVCIA